ncbi:MAG: protein translocase subunit SecF [Mesoaciditoga sp.]|uniref:protein translocase subunit SecF n=1 Tax=Athalassotoga sp. TaxID=2022597 RepID=UPI000CB49BE5|nr:MAG: protein translocase subunit SecF [Mesoaciditoga sp.]PMP80828.1 MAG: protein translocase subunit SecF [Mesoaciditoga sp.]HEU24180.1 protein translocase subunit SecF [Mesoaciditoga lauensis]
MRKMINFVGPRYIFIGISLTVIALSIVFILVKGFNFGVDFAGGTMITASFNKTDLQVGDVRKIFSQADPAFANASIVKMTSITGANANTRSLFDLTVKQFYNAAQKEKLYSAVQSVAAKDNLNVKFESFQTVSGYAAASLRQSSMWAAIIVVILLLIYIGIRYRFVFGIGALASLAHDLIITAGLFSMFWITFDSTAIAALLTLLGYSLNDTVVVYSRIRENLKKMHGHPIDEIVNVSINETLSRTINTSLTTFIVVFTLFLFASSVLRPFAFGMSFGVVTGTYSSIYIASPILIGWLEKRRKSLAKR